MPKLGGHETCKQLRTQMKWNKPIIALTASAMESDKIECLSVGMDDYLPKPFDVNELTRKIDHWVLKDKSEYHESESDYKKIKLV